MAQVVLRPHERVPYLQGPFVVAKFGEKGWCVAAENKGRDYPSVPDVSVRLLIVKWEMVSMSIYAPLVAKTVDRLNEMVSKDVIHLKGECWVIE